jgi:hypothetical protein
MIKVSIFGEEAKKIAKQIGFTEDGELVVKDNIKITLLHRSIEGHTVIEMSVDLLEEE